MMNIKNILNYVPKNHFDPWKIKPINKKDDGWSKIEQRLSKLKKFELNIQNLPSPKNPQILGKGATKLVYKADSVRDDLVYMVPRNWLLHTRELHNEVKISKNIKNEVQIANVAKILETMGNRPIVAKLMAKNLALQFPTTEKLMNALHGKHPRLGFYLKKGSKIDWTSSEIRRMVDSAQNLAVDFAYAPQISINGQKPVVAKKGQGDLDVLMRKEKYGFSNSLKLTLQIMKGFRDLHTAGYQHGDVKLDNVLVYNTEDGPVAKIADWGKAGKSNIKFYHTGNHRFMPPERWSSRKGEVFGVGMITVRLLEQEFLKNEEDMLIQPREIDPKKVKLIKKPRGGIERYFSIAKDAPHKDSVDYFNTFIGTFYSYFSKTSPNIDGHVERYLAALLAKLEEKHGKRLELKELIQLLKEMMRSERKERPTMDKVVPRMQALYHKLK